MEAELVASGRFLRLVTTGHRSGVERAVTIGFVEDPDAPGAVLVAAGEPDTAWAANLSARPDCHVTIADRGFDAVAEPLDGADHARAVAAMILRYGTPAEALGRGTSFLLRPVGDEA